MAYLLEIVLELGMAGYSWEGIKIYISPNRIDNKAE